MNPRSQETYEKRDPASEITDAERVQCTHGLPDSMIRGVCLDCEQFFFEATSRFFPLANPSFVTVPPFSPKSPKIMRNSFVL